MEYEEAETDEMNIIHTTATGDNEQAPVAALASGIGPAALREPLYSSLDPSQLVESPWDWLKRALSKDALLAADLRMDGDVILA